jgi:O-antigen/teichoic acid export membrane protein
LVAAEQTSDYRHVEHLASPTVGIRRPEALRATETTTTDSAGNLRRRAIQGGTVLLAARLVTQVVVWGATLIVARLLLPYDYGVMTTGMIFVGLADLLAEAGVGKALVQRRELTAAHLAEGFTLSLILALGLYGLLLGIASPAAAFLETPVLADFLRVLGLLILLVPFRSIPQAMLERDLCLGKQSVIYVSGAVVQAGLVLALAAAGMGYWALAAGVIVGRTFEAAALTWAAGWRPRLARPGRAAHGLLAFGIHITLGTLLWFIYTNCDYAVIGKLAGPVALGYYALAIQLISLPVNKLTANVNQVVYPVFCRLQGDRERIKDWYLRLTVLLTFIGTPALAGLALIAEDGFPLVLGEQWRPAILPFQLLAAVGILMVLSASLPPLFNALGRPDINLKYTAACTLLLPAGFVVVGKPFGLLGICTVWLAFYPVLVATLVWLTRGLTGIRLADLISAQSAVIAAVLFMVAVVLLGRWLMGNENASLVRMLVSIGLGAGAYGTFLWFVGRRTVLADLMAVMRELRS